MKIFAPAKVNLTLNITGKRADGYHDLQSLVVFADVGDVLSIEPAQKTEIVVSGPFAHMVPEGGDNLVMRAISSMSDVCGVRTGVRIDLEKNLPAQAGLGGGSADAAAAIRGLNMFWGAYLEERILREVGRKIGADVPVCLRGRAQWMEGVGDQLFDVAVPQAMAAVILWPGAGLSTAQMFAGVTQYSDVMARPEIVDFDFIKSGRNDFWDGAKTAMPEVDAACRKMEDAGALFARMSGSGSACVGVFAHMDDAQNAAQILRAAFYGAWISPCYLNV